MMKHWVVVALWVSALSFSTIYSFLPSRHQKVFWVRIFAIIAAIAILTQGIYQIIHNHNSRIFAHVSNEGKILKSKNFLWQITTVRLIVE